jgi:hypothetical protein
LAIAPAFGLVPRTSSSRAPVGLTDSRRDRSGSARSSAIRAWGTWLSNDRSAASCSMAFWIDAVPMSSLTSIRSTQALRRGSVAESQFGLRTRTTVSPGMYVAGV